MKKVMIGAVDEQYVGITQRLRGRQASETAPDNDDLFVRHERELETGYVSERQVSTFGGTDAARRETWLDTVFFPTLVIMTVMQFRQVRVIMGEGEVPVHVRMRFLKEKASLVHVVVMLFVLMAVVMFDFLMPVCMRVAPAEE